MSDSQLPTERSIQSLLVWHVIVWKPSEIETNYAELTTFWDALGKKLGLSAAFPKKPTNLPDEKTLKQREGYALLALRQEPKKADYNYAYAYVNHDVVGIVVVVQSPERDDFANLMGQVPAQVGRLSPLRRFVTLVSLTDSPTVPVQLKEALYEPREFITDQDFTLWNLKPEEEKVSRILAAVPTDTPSQKAFVWFAIGPTTAVCPPLLNYQVQSAKIRVMTAEFNEKYGLHIVGSLRQKRKDVDAKLDEVLASGGATAPVLLKEQQQEGRLTIRRADLQQWLVTLQIAADNMERLQPRAKDKTSPPFAIYQRDKERWQSLRGAIEAEIGYVTATIERLKSLQTVYGASTEREKNYQNLVQTSFLSSIGLGLTVISASAEYPIPEIRWPLVAFSWAVGFAAPILVIHWHEKTTHGAYIWAKSFLWGTGIALAYAYRKALLTRGVVWPPLLDIGGIGLAVFGLALWIEYQVVKRGWRSPLQKWVSSLWRNSQATKTPTEQEKIETTLPAPKATPSLTDALPVQQSIPLQDKPTQSKSKKVTNPQREERSKPL